MILPKEAISQDTLKIKYPYILYSERGKEWVYTPKQTDRIIKTIEKEKELTRKLLIGAERRDSLIQELMLNNSLLKEKEIERLKQVSLLEEKFQLANTSYVNEHKLKLDIEKDLEKQVKIKNRYKNTLIGVLFAATTYVILQITDK